jgi:ABC-type multidrug transport system ATPase subunit
LAAGSPFFSISNIAKSFHHKRVLKSISFQLNSGERTVLIGPNGVGKTTLLKILAGIMRPDKGTGSLNDLPMFTDDARHRNDMILWAHQALFYPAFTAMENLRFFFELRSDIVSNEQIEREFVKYDLHRHKSEPVRIYSAGMLQRLTMIKLTLSSWKLALMDEPTSALDISGLKQLDHLFETWSNEGRSLLFSTHDIQWAEKHSDRVIGIRNGKVELEKSTPKLDDFTTFLGSKS